MFIITFINSYSYTTAVLHGPMVRICQRLELVLPLAEHFSLTKDFHFGKGQAAAVLSFDSLYCALICCTFIGNFGKLQRVILALN